MQSLNRPGAVPGVAQGGAHGHQQPGRSQHVGGRHRAAHPGPSSVGLRPEGAETPASLMFLVWLAVAEACSDSETLQSENPRVPVHAGGHAGGLLPPRCCSARAAAFPVLWRSRARHPPARPWLDSRVFRPPHRHRALPELHRLHRPGVHLQVSHLGEACVQQTLQRRRATASFCCPGWTLRASRQGRHSSAGPSSMWILTAPTLRPARCTCCSEKWQGRLLHIARAAPRLPPYLASNLTSIPGCHAGLCKEPGRDQSSCFHRLQKGHAARWHQPYAAVRLWRVRSATFRTFDLCWPSRVQQLSPVCRFNISLEPSFSVGRMAWILAYGGAYAVANLRWGCPLHNEANT